MPKPPEALSHGGGGGGGGGERQQAASVATVLTICIDNAGATRKGIRQTSIGVLSGCVEVRSQGIVSALLSRQRPISTLPAPVATCASAQMTC